MGIFAWFLRRSKATEKASSAEARADTPTAESEAEGADEVKGSKETAEAVAEAGTEADEAASEGSGTAGDDVEIPKQQTAEKAVDSEAGEGARR